jgi:hypothetical protein
MWKKSHNLIEKLWKTLKDAVQHGSICPKNTSDLRVVIARDWKITRKIISGQKLLLHNEEMAHQTIHWTRLAAKHDPSTITLLVIPDTNWYQNKTPHNGPFSHVIAHFATDTNHI